LGKVKGGAHGINPNTGARRLRGIIKVGIVLLAIVLLIGLLIPLT